MAKLIPWPDPLRLFKGDDWLITETLQEQTGAARDLTGKTVVGQLYVRGGADPIEIAGVVTAPSLGQVSFEIPRATTANIPAGARVAGSWPTRLQIQVVDGDDNRSTVVIQPIEVRDPREVVLDGA